MTARHQHLKTVVDTGPLTIDEIQTARSGKAYTFTTRQGKYLYGGDLNRIRMAVTRELERIGVVQPRAEYDRIKRARKLEHYRAKCREYYQKNRDAINARRRVKK